MAAGLGFKDFTTGEVLTAGDVDGYLMQGVWVFASAAARTSAVASPQEGNMSFLKDTNSVEYYDGAAWSAVGGGAPAFIGALANPAGQTLSNSSNTALQFNTETYDTNSFHDNTTNNSRMTIPSGQGGYYYIYGTVFWNASGSGERRFMLYKNGTNVLEQRMVNAGGGIAPTQNLSVVLNLAAADYVELYAWQDSGGNLAVLGSTGVGQFGVVKLG